MKKIRLKATLLLLCLLAMASYLKAQSIEQLQQGKPTSIRGLSVVDDNVAWISGSKGYIAITLDGGTTWHWQQIKGYEKSDFRDIEAFSGKEAVIMSSGTPALVLKTTDGGISWNVKYSNTDSTYFFDAMDFSDHQHGYILGDPINNKFLLMETKDGGETWHKTENPPGALPNEAAFAASGTCFRIANKNLFIASGGSASDFFNSDVTNKLWSKIATPLVKGKSSTGSFSIAAGNNKLLIVGGDYQADKRTDSTACYSTDKGLTWQLSTTFPAGFQSCVEYIANDIFLSTGTPGSNISTDGGKTWTKIDATSFNVCRRAKRGKLVLLAGNGGKIGILKM